MSDPTLVSVATTATTTGQTTTNATGNLPVCATGDLMVLVSTFSGPSGGTDPGTVTLNGAAIQALDSTHPVNSASWVQLWSVVDTAAANTPRQTVIAKIKASGDTAVTWNAATSTNNSATGGAAYLGGTFDPTNPIPYATAVAQAQTPSAATFATPSTTTTATGLLVSVFGARSGTTWTAPSGDTLRTSAFSSSAANLALTDSGASVAAGTYSKTGTLSAATSVGMAGIFSIKNASSSSQTVSPSGVTSGEAFGGATVTPGPVTVSPGGIATAEAFGTAVVSVGVPGAQTLSPGGIPSSETFGTLSVTNRLQVVSPGGIATAEAFGVATVNALTQVQRVLAAAPFYVYHRGGDADWPQDSAYAYAQATTWNGNTNQVALEVSIFPTSDGYWMLSDTSTTGAVYGTNYTISAQTKATLSALRSTVGNYPPMFLETDILQVYPNFVLWLDNKNSASITALATLLASYGYGPGTGNLVVKSYGGNAPNGWNAWGNSNGIPTWGYFYDTDMAALASYNTSYSILGMDVATGTSSDWTTINGYGKPVMAFIIATAAQKATGASHGVAGYMVSGVTEVVPAQAAPQTLSPGGIPSAEAFGVPVMNVRQTVSPSGVVSGEAFGSVTVSAGPVTVSPSGVGSGEQFGAPTVTMGAVTLSVSGIPSVEAFGAAVVHPGPVTVSLFGVLPGEAFGNPVVLAGGALLQPVGVPSAETFGNPTVTPGPVTVSAFGILPTEAFGTLTIINASGPQTVSVTGIPSGEQFGQARVFSPTAGSTWQLRVIDGRSRWRVRT